MTTEQRIGYFKTPEFRRWVDAEKAAGHQVFWLKDIDGTQTTGDVFTAFFEWRAKNNKFTDQQLATMDKYLQTHFPDRARQPGESAAQQVIRLWKDTEHGQAGLNVFDFWKDIYWSTQQGLTPAEKIAEANAFAPSYADRIYQGVTEENKVLADQGVNVVLVSNGDQDLARAIAPVLGVKPENAVGSNLLYDSEGHSTGINHSYEQLDGPWRTKPQAGKALSFHYWLNMNKERWGWTHIDDEKVVLAGRDGDSAASDGGMMMLLKPPAIGNFIIDTPGSPERAQKFYQFADKYGWTPGQFITLSQKPSASELLGAAANH
jgi:hypothetical protein